MNTQKIYTWELQEADVMELTDNELEMIVGGGFWEMFLGILCVIAAIVVAAVGTALIGSGIATGNGGSVAGGVGCYVLAGACGYAARRFFDAV